MSEYQYYEFQAADRPLTRQQMSELRGYSTRAEITPTRFVNSYNWGSFKGNAEQWMERYFDAHLYFANWGTRILMLRIPERLLDKEVLEEYCADETVSLFTSRLARLSCPSRLKSRTTIPLRMKVRYPRSYLCVPA